ncbi:hypothetical protein ACFVH0_34665, partial [Streptomyces sp. NPDC127117]|uniref:hypothetical protein n=1 Tax=Streptomyces sp. NPDC127117 TaxID=3345368 RepID=UPI003629D6BB
VNSVFHAVARPVNRAIDKIVNFIAKKGKALWAKLKGNETTPKKNKDKDNTKNQENNKSDPTEAQVPKSLITSSTPSLDGPGQKISQEIGESGGEQTIFSRAGDARTTTKNILQNHRDAKFEKSSKTLTLPKISISKTPDSLAALGEDLGRQTGVSKVSLEKKGNEASIWGSINPRIRLATLANLDQDLAIVMLAVEKSGDVVKFLKEISSKGGQKTIEVDKGGIKGKMNLELFEKAWNKKIDNKLAVRAWIKTQFRQVMPNHHEWIPSDFILEVTKQASTMAEEGPGLLALQNDLRNQTFCVVFNETMGRPETVDNHFVPNGHAGAVYFAESQPSRGQLKGKRSTWEEDFHDELRDAFLSSTGAKDAATKALAVAKKWIWNGDPMSLPIHPDCLDRTRRPIDANTQKNRYQEIIDKFNEHTG